MNQELAKIYGVKKISLSNNGSCQNPGKRRIFAKAAFYMILILFTAFFFYPLYLILVSSFKTPLEIFGSPFSFPHKLEFDNYVQAWQKMNFTVILGNSLIMTVCSTLGLIFFGSMAAYACARNNSRFIKGAFFLFISCIVVPFHTAMIPLVRFMSQMGLYNSYFGVIMVYLAINMSFTIFLYTGFIKSIPRELEEAALVDGCSRMGIFWKVIFPLVAPVTATVAILSSLNIWNDFLIPLLLISSPARRNIPNALFAFQGQYDNKWELAFASLILSVIPIIIFYLSLQKNIIKGATQGAIKG